MTRVVQLCAAALIGTASVLPGAAHAEGAAGKPDGTALQQAVEQRISALQLKLAITPAEMADWMQFAQVMRDNAADTDRQFAQRAEADRTMSAVQDMNSYAAVARAYADDTEKLARAFAAFYAKLSPAQQQIADALFRDPGNAGGAGTAPGPHR